MTACPSDDDLLAFVQRLLPADTGATIESHIAAFQASGGLMQDAVFAVYTSDDFVKF